MASVLAVILDIGGSALCLALRRSVVVTTLLVGSLACKVAVPATLILGNSQNPLFLFLAPVTAIWLAWVLFCVALQRHAVTLGRDEVAQEGTPILMIGTAILLGIAIALMTVTYLFSRNQEAAILLALVASVAYVISTLIFCIRYMNFLDAVARIEQAAI
jgi:hypothetical protein